MNRQVNTSRWVLILGLSACTPTPPPYWADGGATLEIPEAEWQRRSGEPVLIAADGKVTRDDELLFNIDAAGRVFDEDNEPLGLVGPDGHVFGTGGEMLGRVGVRNASPPWSPVAWMRVSEQGTLMLFDGDGQPAYGGQWTGCTGPGLRTCTLVSHLVILEAVKRYLAEPPYRPTTFGVGVGVWY
jgi:hypothetical protein